MYITDTLEEDLDDSTLTVNNGGTYDPSTRSIKWFIGELGSKQKGSVSFSVNVRQDAQDKSEVINFATVYFPSVPETTRTNGTVNRITTATNTTPPTTTATPSPQPNPAGWNNSDVTIALSAVDNEGGSGVAKTEYSLDNTNWLIYATPFTITNEGTTTLYYKSTDNAGNIEISKSLEIKIDKTPPTITSQTSPAPNSFGWNNTDVTVTFNASDNLSGIQSVTQPIVASTEGANQYIGAEAVDIAGNRATTYVTLNIDKTPPQMILQLKPISLSEDHSEDEDKKEEGDGEGNWYELTYSATDSLSGLNTLQAGLITIALNGYQVELEQEQELDIRIDEKKKELEIEAPNPQEILTQLQNGLLNLTSNQILQLKLKQGQAKWKIKQKEKGIEIEAPAITFKAEATDLADNKAIKELEFKGKE